MFISRGMDDPELAMLRFKPDLTDEEKIRVNTYLLTFFEYGKHLLETRHRQDGSPNRLRLNPRRPALQRSPRFDLGRGHQGTLMPIEARHD